MGFFLFLYQIFSDFRTHFGDDHSGLRKVVGKFSNKYFDLESVEISNMVLIESKISFHANSKYIKQFKQT